MTDDTFEVPALVTWPDVELGLLAVGEWALSSGVANFTAADLTQACAAVACPAVGSPVIKLGHTDPRFIDPQTGEPAMADGEPAIGWVANMRANDTLTKVLGDFTGMPGWLGAILPSAYPERSIEGTWDFVCQIGHRHPFVITAVALLGVVPPGVGTIGSLNDVAALYGVDLPNDEPEPADAQAARRFRTLPTRGAAMPARAAGVHTATPGRGTESADAAGVVPTVDDIRRQYYETADWSAWIVEVQLTAEGPVLIVIDDSTGDLTRVPVSATEGSAIEFGDPSPVLVSYVDAPKPKDAAARSAAGVAAAFPPGRQVAAAWGDRATSRAGVAVAAAISSHSTATDTGSWDGAAAKKNLSSDATSSTYRQAYAWADPDADADTQAGYSFIHHFVGTDGSVGAASTVACSTGIGVLNGGRGGSNVPDSDVQGVYRHLARHLTDAGMEAPELTAAAPAPPDEETGEVSGVTRHGAFDGEHSHAHIHGGESHVHSHTHSGNGSHGHSHSDADNAAAADAAATMEGADMQVSDETAARVRAALSLADDVEITEEHLVQLAAAQAPGPGGGAQPLPAGAVDASAPETPVVLDGTYLVDGEIIQNWRNRAVAGDNAVRQLSVRDRDTVLAAAVAVGKFPQSRLSHYETMWDKDPDGTRKHVDALASGLVPMGDPTGRNAGWDPDLPGDFEGQNAYRQLYPDDVLTRGGNQS